MGKYFWKDFKFITHTLNQFNQITHLRQRHWEKKCLGGSLRKVQKDEQAILEVSWNLKTDSWTPNAQDLEKQDWWEEERKGRTGDSGRWPALLSAAPLHLCSLRASPSVRRWGGGNEAAGPELIPPGPSEDWVGRRATFEGWVPGPMVRKEDLDAEILHVTGRCTNTIFRKNYGLFSPLWLSKLETNIQPRSCEAPWLIKRESVGKRSCVPSSLLLPKPATDARGPSSCPKEREPHRVGPSGDDMTEDPALDFALFQEGRKDHWSLSPQTLHNCLRVQTFSQQALGDDSYRSWRNFNPDA